MHYFAQYTILYDEVTIIKTKWKLVIQFQVLSWELKRGFALFSQNTSAYPHTNFMVAIGTRLKPQTAQSTHELPVLTGRVQNH